MHIKKWHYFPPFHSSSISYFKLTTGITNISKYEKPYELLIVVNTLQKWKYEKNLLPRYNTNEITKKKP